MTESQPCDEYENWKQRGGKPYSTCHRWLYQEAAKGVAGKSVLEIGAGIGDGIEILQAAGAAKITAIEPNPDSFHHLVDRFPDLEAHQCGLLDWFDLREPAPFHDVAVCIEVVEHLSALDVHPFLLRARRCCGKLYLSSPDRRKVKHGTRSPLEWQLTLKAAGFTPSEPQQNDWAILIVAE